VIFDAWIDFSKQGNFRFYSIELRRVGGHSTNVDNSMLAVMVDFTDLMQQKQKAEAANKAKSDFLATISHEIRTPMNVIFGMGTALGRMISDPELQRYINGIRQASHSLLAIVNDILDFSRIEAGKMEIVNARYNLLDMVNGLQVMFSDMCSNKGIELIFDISPSLPVVAIGDEGRLRQVLHNLLFNAIKFTDNGSITFATWLDHDMLHFDIRDTGVGIKESDLDRLFTPFEQLGDPNNHRTGSSGLGLPISNSLCRIMGGSISVKSIFGEGSTFSVRLPYLSVDDDQANNLANEVLDFIAPRARILVVDDMETNLTVAEVMLDIFEIVPEFAQSGKEAILKVSENEYDLIFMDHMMPEMDGVETTGHIRGLSGRHAKMPIIALTANAIKGTEQMFLENGFNDVLPKPIELHAMNTCLRKWLPDSLIEEEI